MDLAQRAQVLLRQTDDIAATLVSAVWGHLPGYDTARMDVQDLAEVVALNVRALVTAVAARRVPRGEDLAPAAALGQRRAIQGVPVEGVVGSWHAAERELLERFAAVGPRLDTASLIDLSHRLAAATDTMIEATIDAYRTTRTESAGHLDQIATDLVSRLAGGEPMDPADVEERARLVGVPAQVPHLAAAIGLPERAGPLALTRAHRIILDAVTPRLRSRLLVGGKGPTLLLVLADTPGIPEAFARAATRPGVPEGLVVGLGNPRPRLGEAGASCREAMSALSAGLRMGADRAVVPFERVVPEVLLLGNPIDARLLRDTILTPLRASPALVETLRVFLTSGLSTRVTAQRLSIHENTVSYRVRRILGLLGAESAAELVRPDVLLALRADELLPREPPSRLTPG
ncbi:helix-turn-helix domain-containing protein [Spongiactinospora sp. TRM90649]|uniref:PucR family transcriptional regulator n=1 Tax=Spongiactinospora sp. TRM90649 TaxID=3031114 RepID=UPI0023F6FAA0|nr:helix-turn-helix domain-containing protein [Spongiactinospora sp. TRM90649]MDF5756036.1 helix-turn-helix domain-containing protein [Spongiactinospora sp. TRM90649]